MHTITQPRTRNLGKIAALLLAASLVGLLALMLMSGGGTTDGGALPGNEPALPQNARYPLDLDKFAPGRIAPSVEQPATLSAQLMVCHGEGLIDLEVRASVTGSTGSVARYCSPRARLAGRQDEAPESGTLPCHNGLPNQAIYADLSDEAILIGEGCASSAQPRRHNADPLLPTEGLVP